MKTPYALAEFWGFDAVAKVLKTDDTTATAKEDEPTTKTKFTQNTINYFAGSPLNR